MRLSGERPYVYRYNITCPHCDGKSYTIGWKPGYCPHCGADLGGCSKETLKAVEDVLELVMDKLTGQAVVLPESA